MPSLGDVANQIKAILEDVKDNTLGTRNNTSTIITRLDTIDSTLQAGFVNLSQGLGVLIALGTQNNALTQVNNKQNETIICWLDNIAHVLCDIKHNTDREVDLQTSIRDILARLDQILTLVHSREALEVANNAALQAKIEACCPPAEPPVKPCFEECRPPRTEDIPPVKSDWAPLRPDNRDRSNRPA